MKVWGYSLTGSLLRCSYCHHFSSQTLYNNILVTQYATICNTTLKQAANVNTTFPNRPTLRTLKITDFLIVIIWVTFYVETTSTSSAISLAKLRHSVVNQVRGLLAEETTSPSRPARVIKITFLWKYIVWIILNVYCIYYSKYPLHGFREQNILHIAFFILIIRFETIEKIVDLIPDKIARALSRFNPYNFFLRVLLRLPQFEMALGRLRRGINIRHILRKVSLISCDMQQG